MVSDRKVVLPFVEINKWFVEINEAFVEINKALVEIIECNNITTQ